MESIPHCNKIQGLHKSAGQWTEEDHQEYIKEIDPRTIPEETPVSQPNLNVTEENRIR